MMKKAVAVQQKIPCVYVTGVFLEPSAKRKYQPFKVSALTELTKDAQQDNLDLALITEKIDGTCCLVDTFEGQPWLWARHDRKPSKAGEKKLAQWKKSQAAQEQKENPDTDTGCGECQWNFDADFKSVPAMWIPATGLETRDGFVLPDGIGHTPGWVPVELTSRQHCWHLQTVNWEQGLALVLRMSEASSEELIVLCEPLSSLCGQTLELIGTNVNANPYGLGSKKCPLHLLVPHGSIPVSCPSPWDQSAVIDWMASEEREAQVEGVVWHCAGSRLHKVHRHHLHQQWPVTSPRLSSLPVTVQVEPPEGSGPASLFTKLSGLRGQRFDNLPALNSGLVGRCDIAAKNNS